MFLFAATMRREPAEKNLIKNHIVKRYAQHIVVVVQAVVVVILFLFLYVFVMRAFVAIFGFCLCATNQQRQLHWAKT